MARKPKPHDFEAFAQRAAAKAAAAALRPRRVKLPKEFVKHDGGECPVDPGTFVEVLVMTTDGVGSGQVHPASDHHWPHAEHVDGLGAILFYRVVERGDPPLFDVYDRFRVKGG